MAAADFNGDGKLDLVTADGGTVSVLLGTGDRHLRRRIMPSAARRLAVAAGDFNGDGRPDVAAANASSNNVSVLLNDGIWPALDAPSITINDVTVTEGNTGTTNATFTVSLSAAYEPDGERRLRHGGRQRQSAGGDYQATSGTLTFAPGETSKTVTVLVNGDRLAESSESFFVRLSNPTNAFIADATGVGTIVDDEPS